MSKYTEEDYVTVLGELLDGMDWRDIQEMTNLDTSRCKYIERMYNYWYFDKGRETIERNEQ